MSGIHGNKLGAQILEALGLAQHNVRRLELVCDVNEAAHITLTQYIVSDDNLVETLRHYELVEREVTP